MARLRLDISEEAYLQLLKIAVAERRPADWQAEVILEHAIARHGLSMLRPEGELASTGDWGGCEEGAI